MSILRDTEMPEMIIFFACVSLSITEQRGISPIIFYREKTKHPPGIMKPPPHMACKTVTEHNFIGLFDITEQTPQCNHLVYELHILFKKSKLLNAYIQLLEHY